MHFTISCSSYHVTKTRGYLGKVLLPLYPSQNEMSGDTERVCMSVCTITTTGGIIDVPTTSDLELRSSALRMAKKKKPNKLFPNRRAPM